jgi:PadR family transcriptional regulator, regulatory protein PadR
MDDLTGFQRDALYVIEGLGDPHGLGIKAEMEKYYAQEVHHGRLYPNLDALVHKGFVSKEELDRRTNTYRLTERGERELEARREWENQYVGSMLAEA